MDKASISDFFINYNFLIMFPLLDYLVSNLYFLVSSYFLLFLIKRFVGCTEKEFHEQEGKKNEKKGK
jgi:hypothetical protein